MLHAGPILCTLRTLALTCAIGLMADRAFAAPPGPVLSSVFPPGCQAGTSADLTLTGTALDGLRGVECNATGVRSKVIDASHVRLTVPADTVPGCYDLWTLSANGISSPRSFVISNRTEVTETEPTNSPQDAILVTPDCVINGRIESAADIDSYRFQAMADQQFVFECAAERIDSPLRVVLTVFSPDGRQLAVNRGYFGIDPLISLKIPEDGEYKVQVQSLTPGPGGDQFYRLELDTKSRVLFARPDVLQRGTTTQVELFGWNLTNGNRRHGNAANGDQAADSTSGFDRLTVDITVPAVSSGSESTGSPKLLAHDSTLPRPLQMRAAQAASDLFPWSLPESHSAIFFGLTDLPVTTDRSDNHSPASAQSIDVPGVVAGQLTKVGGQDWFAFSARRGEIFYLEGTGQRINSPVDLEISVFDQTGQQELIQSGDETFSAGGRILNTTHSDPVVRWVAPDDGRYLVQVRNIGGGASMDPRRIYRLSLRREDGGLHLLATPMRDAVGRLNLGRGSREVLHIVALRERGLDGTLRISAQNLPSGVECPDVWLGPGVNTAAVVVSADYGAADIISALQLVGSVEDASRFPGGRFQNVPVQFATSISGGTPIPRNRLISKLPLAVTGEASIKMSADGHEALQHPLYGTIQVQHSPGGMLDVAVQFDRRDGSHTAPVRLTGVGLPPVIRNETIVIPAGQAKGYLSFLLPPTLLPGRYSLAIQAETTVSGADQKAESVVVCSNPVTFDVKPAAFAVEVDPFLQRSVRRGETFQVSYMSRRQNGFIGKMHTELAVPGIVTDVPGLRGRGETFTGQTDQGSLQVLVNQDATLGPQRFLRLLTVGVVEDQPVYFGSAVLPLEVTE